MTGDMFGIGLFLFGAITGGNDFVGAGLLFALGELAIIIALVRFIRECR